jgi:hypothetical protein
MPNHELCFVAWEALNALAARGLLQIKIKQGRRYVPLDPREFAVKTPTTHRNSDQARPADKEINNPERNKQFRRKGVGKIPDRQSPLDVDGAVLRLEPRHR